MLILDKQKAVQHMVALTEGQEEEDGEEAQVAVAGRRRQRVATFERRATAATPDAPHPARRKPAAQRAGGVSIA
jgi:hypothetical protein